MNKQMMCAAAALMLAACGREGDERANLAQENLAMESDPIAANAGAPAAIGAAEFADKAAASDKYEIESGKLAASKASSAGVRSFAEMLVTAHTQSTADLKSAASQATPAITPSETLDAEKQAMLTTLQGLSGEAFDTQFIEQQITAHEKASALLQSYGASGDNDALKAFAAKTAPVVQGHLEEARALKK